MSIELDKSDFPITWEAASLAKKTLLFHSYGEFDGFRKPAIGELMMLKGAIDGAIFELQNERMSNDG